MRTFIVIGFFLLIFSSVPRAAEPPQDAIQFIKQYFTEAIHINYRSDVEIKRLDCDEVTIYLRSRSDKYADQEISFPLRAVRIDGDKPSSSDWGGITFTCVLPGCMSLVVKSRISDEKFFARSARHISTPIGHRLWRAFDDIQQACGGVEESKY